MSTFDPSPRPWRINRHGEIIDANNAIIDIYGGSHNGREIATACLMVSAVNSYTDFAAAQDIYDTIIKSEESKR